MAQTRTGRNRLPRFIDYQVASTMVARSTPARLNWPMSQFPTSADQEVTKTDPLLQSIAREGPNFAGHFTIVQWEHQSHTYVLWIVDSTTGKVHRPVLLGVDGDPLNKIPALTFRNNGRLLILRGCRILREGEGWLQDLCGTFYYAWDGDALHLVRSTNTTQHQDY